MNNNFDFDDFLVEDIIWTLKNFSKKIKHWENIDWKQRMKKEEEDPYVIAARAALIVAKIGYGECFAIDDFIEEVKKGNFINNDGSGTWTDKKGTALGYIQCNVDWLTKFKPENAEFIMWYNK